MESLNLLTENVFQMYDKINVMRLRNSQEVKIFLEIEFRKLIIEIEKPTVSGLLKKIADLTREIQNESQSLPANPVTKKEIVDSLKQKKESLLENKLVDNNDMNTSDKMEFFVKENFKGTDVDPSTMPEI